MQRRTIVQFFIVMLVLGSAGCGGERLVDVQIERDNEPLLQGQFGLSDAESSTAAWKHLSDQRYKAVGHFSPDSSDPRKALLKGKVRIVLRHAGNVLAAAQVEQLELKLVPGTDNYWMIPDAEVERTLKAAEIRE